MNKLLLAIAISLAAGLAAGAYIVNSGVTSSGDSASGGPAPMTFDPNAGVEERIAALEAAVSSEREARRILEDELLALYAEIELMRPAPEDVAGTAGGEFVRELLETDQPPGNDRGRGRPRTPETQVEAMVENGLSQTRAEYIIRRESELQYEQMQAMYQARNSDNPQESFRNFRSAEQMLRTEIGDADYEKYLEALGRPTSVGVNGIMASSPAAAAGLQEGDRVIAYDGQRIFSPQELVQYAMDGQTGGTVVLDIDRNGTPMQVTVPHGPIGIEVFGRRRNR